MSKLSVTARSRRVLSSVLWIAAATFMVLGLSAGAASAAPDQVDICHKGKTLSLNVHAALAHLEHGDHLSCDEGTCPCSNEFDPVTCTMPDGSTRLFANQCLADCAGATGPCNRLGVCSNIYLPVTCNGVVYANECQARNAGCPGPFTALCPCPSTYAPVRCGNGRIYANACAAECDGASGCTPLD
jgi:hypothetical protein